jgi:lipoprotein-releasing system permease protein
MTALGAFELFVAGRYLRAKRKQAVISVITVISIIGVAAGVMALVVALAINNGFRNTLQRNLLGATAHVSILERQPGGGIDNWRDVADRLRRLPHVTNATPGLYGQVLFSAPGQSTGGIMKGIPVDGPPSQDVLMRLKQGSFERLRTETGRAPGIIVGASLAQNTGMRLNDIITVISPYGTLTPMGARPAYLPFRVVGIYQSGFYDLDSAWAYASLKSVQSALAVGDVVNTIELKLDDIYKAPEVAAAADRIIPKTLAATTWMEQNRQIRNALQMERVVTVITIGLIQLVAALNIFITLVMMVMEKHKDIAILMSMGARREQIRRIFMYQGVLIGTVGAAIGLVIGYAICYFAGTYHWIRLDEQVYSLSFVPFEPNWFDGIWIAAAAIGVSFFATLYPARNATRIAPAVALRYE